MHEKSGEQPRLLGRKKLARGTREDSTVVCAMSLHLCVFCVTEWTGTSGHNAYFISVSLALRKLFLKLQSKLTHEDNYSLMKMTWKPGNVRRIPLSIMDSMQDLGNHFKCSELAFSTCEAG
ncbi:hypothetical protein STEG23_003780, partial [Scotinomys teguina]